MSPASQPLSEASAPERPAGRSILGRILLRGAALAAAAAAFVAHQHFKLQGQSTPALVSLIVAAVLAFAPLRALLGEFFAIERRVLHAFHGLGALALMGLSAGGVFSGGSLLNHAALAPFALMGAAQAVMHQDHPRNAQQAAALQRFASSLPEVAQFTRGSLTSPANAARAVTVLQDLITKAEALGETELQADPNFQSALARATTRTGLTLGLDSIDQAINKLAANPATATAVPELRRRLARARQIAETKGG
jgi:hypothetical protein